MATNYVLKPFTINPNDLVFLLAQVNFVPLFDGPANCNGIVNFNPATMDALDSNATRSGMWRSRDRHTRMWSSRTRTSAYSAMASRRYLPRSASAIQRPAQQPIRVSSRLGRFRRPLPPRHRRRTLTNYVTSDGLGAGYGHVLGGILSSTICRASSAARSRPAGVNLLR